jgi:hypothetical protein
MARKSNTIGMACDDDWRAESDLRTLIEAEQIEKDPKRLKKAKELAKKRLLEVAAIAGGSDAD